MNASLAKNHTFLLLVEYAPTQKKIYATKIGNAGKKLCNRLREKGKKILQKKLKKVNKKQLTFEDKGAIISVV